MPDKQQPEAEQPAPPKFARGRSYSEADDNTPVDVAHFEHAVGMLLDRVDALQASQTDAIAQAIRQVLTDKATAQTLVANVREAAKAEAIEAAGRGLWGVVGSLFSKWWLIALVTLIVAKVAGWGPAVAVGKWLAGVTT